MKLTRKKAKELSILKWQWFYDHPTKKNFFVLPGDLQDKLKGLNSNCPLCEMYFDHFSNDCFIKCPFMKANQECGTLGSYYLMWIKAKTAKTRKKYAGFILQIIKDWSWSYDN